VTGMSHSKQPSHFATYQTHHYWGGGQWGDDDLLLHHTSPCHAYWWAW